MSGCSGPPGGGLQFVVSTIRYRWLNSLGTLGFCFRPLCVRVAVCPRDGLPTARKPYPCSGFGVCYLGSWSAVAGVSSGAFAIRDSLAGSLLLWSLVVRSGVPGDPGAAARVQEEQYHKSDLLTSWDDVFVVCLHCPDLRFRTAATRSSLQNLYQIETQS